MNPIAIIIILVILVLGYMYWKGTQSTNGGTGGSPGGGYTGPSPAEINTAVPGRMYGSGASKIDYVTSWEDCASACNDYAGCVGAGYYVSLPQSGGTGKYSCYLYPETALGRQWRSAPVAVGDAVSQSLADVVPLNKGSITSATPGRIVGPEADITYQTDFPSCAATCATPCIGAGLYVSLPQPGGTGKYSCYTYDTTAGTRVIPPAAPGDVYSSSLYPAYAGS
jgi:hypothetical protein